MRARRWRRGAVVAAAGLLLLVVPASARAARDRVVQVVPAVAGRPAHVRVTVGDVVVRGEPRTDIAVEVDREVPDGVSPDALPVRIEPESDALRVSALQSGQSRDPALRARVVVAVPIDTAVLVEVGEGGCEVDGVRAPVQVKVERGGVHLSGVAGIVRAETRTGDIRVERAALPPEGLLRLRTLSGDVSVQLSSRPSDARVLLLALSGRVESTLPLEARGGPGRRIREAVLGTGKALLSVDVVRGDIKLEMP